jgi:N-dimethylarginine dimethylaminohydrolase
MSDVFSEFGPWTHIVVHDAAHAFGNEDQLEREWRALNFTAKPDYALAVRQYERFAELLSTSGAEIVDSAHSALSTQHPALSLDSIYVRDASVMSPRGAILCRMGKPQREGEPLALAGTYRAMGIDVIGVIEAPGTLEGGDVTWLGPRLVAVGRGYRTNDEGIRQFRALLADTVDDVITVPLPHYRGPGDVFHLMSIISPVDRDLAVVYSPLMPVPFRERLLALGYSLAEVPDDEFDSMGANVFALSPRRCLMVDGNPQTRAALERAGAEVVTYDGSEISLKGGGGSIDNR